MFDSLLLRIAMFIEYIAIIFRKESRHQEIWARFDRGP
jgi:hypothetical protein